MHKRAAYYSDKEIQDNKMEANLFDLGMTWEAIGRECLLPPNWRPLTINVYRWEAAMIGIFQFIVAQLITTGSRYDRRF